MRRVLTAAAGIAALFAVPVARAQGPAPAPANFGTFRSVLAQGEGQTVNAGDLAAYEANGTVPDSFVNQQPLYVGIMPRAATLAPADLNTFYKTTDFGLDDLAARGRDDHP